MPEDTLKYTRGNSALGFCTYVVGEGIWFFGAFFFCKAIAAGYTRKTSCIEHLFVGFYALLSSIFLVFSTIMHH